MSLYMLDTNICIFMMKRKSETLLRNVLRHKKSELFISSIVYCELLFGIEKSVYKERNLQNLETITKDIKVLPYTCECSKSYGVIRYELERKGTTIGPNDMLIASHTKALDMILVTNNTREFSRIYGLEIEDWT